MYESQFNTLKGIITKFSGSLSILGLLTVGSFLVGSQQFTAGNYIPKGVHFSTSDGYTSSTPDFTYTTGTKILAVPNITTGNATATGSIRSSGYMLNANNLYDFGSSLNSAKNIYSSGTIFSVNQIVSGNVTTTGLETGAFVSTPDAGYIPLYNAVISGTATNTRQGAYFSVGGTPIFGFNCLSDGAGACKTSSTRLTINAPMNCPVTATTTVATSTVLGLESGCYEVIGSNVGTTIQTQLFATTTVMSIGGTEICISGTSDTSTVTIADTAEVHTSGGVAKVLGDGDEWCGKYMYSRNYWKESGYFDN